MGNKNMDTLSKEDRHWLMSRVKSKNTSTELLVRSFLHRNGFRFRLHVRGLPGTPDIVLPKYKTIVDIRGCYWHRHKNCKLATIPSSNYEFWGKKFQNNIDRDKKNTTLLRDAGWQVIILWQCEIESGRGLFKLLSILQKQISIISGSC